MEGERNSTEPRRALSPGGGLGGSVDPVSLRVTVLGSSGSYAAPGNPCTGFLLSCGGGNLLLDCGPGTRGPLQEQVSLDDLDAVIVTHCHPDHWLELAVLSVALRYYRPRPPLAVFAGAETWDLGEALLGVGDAAPAFETHVVGAGDSWEVGPFAVTTSRTAHPVETMAVKVTAAGRSVTFSSDTGPAWDPASLGSTDLLVHEATFLDADPRSGSGVHSTAAEAGAAARRASAPRLVLTHLAPGGDVAAFEAEASGAYGAPVHAAQPGDVLIP